MNKIKNFFSGKFLIYFLMLSPLVDVITSIMVYYDIKLSLGIAVKGFALLYAFVYMIFIDKTSRKINYSVLGVLALFSACNILNNLDIVKINVLTYLNYLVKYNFLVIMTLYFITYLKSNKVKLITLKTPIVLLSIMLIVSNITGTAFYTYDSARMGTCIWYYSGNEIGSILTIMYALSIILFLDKKQSRKIEIIYPLIIGGGLLYLGTKVGLLSYIIITFGYLVFRIFTVKKYKLNYSFYSILLFFMLVIINIKYMPTVVNMSNRYDYYYDNESTSSSQTDTLDDQSIILKLLFSGRIDYLNKVRASSRNTYDLLVGKPYLENNNYLTIESDFLDTYYMFGIVGFIVLYGMYLFMIIVIMIKFLKVGKYAFSYTKICMLIFTLALILFISLLVGHTILSPPVSLYIAFLFSYLYTYEEFVKKSSNKTKLLISSVNMKVGGIETTLINLLNNIDYDKYEVDLFLLLSTGENFKNINKNVKVIYPYGKLFIKFFEKESKISKIIKHALFNRFTAFLYTTNKTYDVAINYAGYYLFIDRYTSFVRASKHIIWVHTDLNKQYEVNDAYKKKFNIHKNKYKHYDEIACVSQSAKDEFVKILPQYTNKLVVVWNIIKVNSINNDFNPEFDGKFNIVSVGRLCAQKCFSKLVDVHKMLIDNKYEVKTYLIGDGEEREELENKVKDLKLNSTFIFLGKKNNVMDYLNKADLFVSSSIYEALPTVLLESLSARLPWVGPNVCGIRDIHKYISPQNASILTGESAEDIYKAVVDAINGKISKKFKFDLNEYNEKALNSFYSVCKKG